MDSIQTFYGLLTADPAGYAREQLSGNEQLVNVHRRYTTYIVERSRDASVDWKRLPKHEWHDRYRDDTKDVRAVLSKRLTHANSRDTGARLLTTAIPFWVEFSLMEECRQLISLALAIEVDFATHQRMALYAALGTSLTGARGPVDKNFRA
ncbi:hypothetical protein [Cupriavidus nantongensis]|uniref:hypothetical protein n=1 Tax=Cupriavidus nantongensis TaxID=1796606 RepID=UPI00358E3659